MAHKTLTISEEAYNALSMVKGKDESFTKVILRLAKRRSSGDLLDYVRSMPPNEELASAIEWVLEKRKFIRLRARGRKLLFADTKLTVSSYYSVANRTRHNRF